MSTYLTSLETELKKRINKYPYTPWGRKQADDWDRKTNFIYRTSYWDNLWRIVGDMPEELRHYAINRWFNYWSATGVETIFCNLPGVIAAKNPKDRLVDFTIQGIRFDHKTTVFPGGYQQSPRFAAINPQHLVTWLYQNQSAEKRYHTANRLFVVLHDDDGEHWKLRAELSVIKQQVEQYIQDFAQERLISLSLDGSEVLTDVIWVPNEPQATIVSP